MKLQMFDYKQKFHFITEKLNVVISQGSSGSVVKDAGVKYGGPRFGLW